MLFSSCFLRWVSARWMGLYLLYKLIEFEIIAIKVQIYCFILRYGLFIQVKVEKTGEIKGAIALLKLKIFTNINIIQRLRAYSNKYTKKLKKYFFSEYFFSLKVYLELK